MFKKFGVLAAVAAALLLAGQGLAQRREEIIIGPCNRDRLTGVVSRLCFESLIARPDVAEVLDDRASVPALADGRLSTAEIVRQLQISEAVPTTRLLGEEADPEEDAVLDRHVLEELRRAEGFEISSAVFTSAGPILVENYVPSLEDGFPFVPIPDNKNYLDIVGFTLDLHDTLAANVNGYAMRMRANGQTVSTLQWNWARNPFPADAPAAG